MAKKGGWAPQNSTLAQSASQERLLNLKSLWKTPFLNPNPFTPLSGPKNIVQVRINHENTWALLDNGSTINAVTPDFMEAWSLDVSLLSDLVNSTMGINGFRGLYSWPLGYVIIRVQVEGVRGYDEYQVALVVQDSTTFGSQVSVTLDTPTINCIVNMIRESKIGELLASLNGLRISCLLTCCPAELSIRREMAVKPITGLPNLNEGVKMIRKEEIETFSYKIIHVQTKTILLGSNMHMMTQSLEGPDGLCLPGKLSVMNTYTEMITGSKQVAVVVKNLTATHHFLGHHSHPSSSHVLSAPAGGCARNIGEARWDSGCPVN